MRYQCKKGSFIDKFRFTTGENLDYKYEVAKEVDFEIILKKKEDKK